MNDNNGTASVASTTKLLLTPDEAAASLGISKRTLWTLKDEGKIRATKIKRCVRYSITALQNFVNDQTEAGGEV